MTFEASTRSTSAGWRSDHNRKQLGYFRTDDETTDRILAMLVKSGEYQPHVYDPCCGEGIALAAATSYLEGISYGVEYDASRFLEAVPRVDHLLHGDAIAEFYGSAKWAGLMWFNPPYDTVTRQDGSTIRLERLFWEKHADRLMKGGVMVAILPDYLFDRAPDMPGMFSRYFAGSQVHVYRTPDQTFKQLVIIGKRSTSDNPSAERNLELAELLQAIAHHETDVPELPKVGSGPTLVVPVGCAPANFEVYTLSPTAIQHLVSTHLADHLKHLDQVLQPPEAHQRRRSVMPLREGHVPALLASGGLNGIVEDEHGRYLVRGIARRILKTAETVESDSETHTNRQVETTVHTWGTSIAAWDLTPGRNFPLLEIL